MKKKKEVRRIVVLSALAALGFGGVAVSSTYALFTSESKTNVTVASGKVDVESTITDLVTYSGNDLTGNSSTDQANIAQTSDGNFTNGGTAKINDAGDLELAGVTPGDKVTFKIKVKNNSTVAIKYRTLIKEASDGGLFSGLTFKIGGFTTTGRTKWAKLEAGSNSDVEELECEVSLPSDADNQYQDKSATISFAVEAVQGNAQTYVYPTGVTKDNFGDNKVAYTKANDSTVYYSTDFKTAVNNNANAIYVSEDAVFTNTDKLTHLAIRNDLVVYANDANFLDSDLAINYGNGNTAPFAPTDNDVSLTINDAINLRVWGFSPKEGVTNDVILNNCSYYGGGRTTNGVGLSWIDDATESKGTLNITQNNCYTSDVGEGIKATCAGSVNINNSTFNRCAIGIKAGPKTSGTLNMNINNTTFNSCGCLEQEAGNNAWLYKESSAIRCKTNGTVELQLTNVAVNNTIGDCLFNINNLSDTGYNGKTNVSATNVTVDGKAYTFNN